MLHFYLHKFPRTIYNYNIERYPIKYRLGGSMNEKQIKLVRAALLLAIALLSQQLRFILPLPKILDTLVIGTLVNASLVLTAHYTDLFLAAITTIALPIVAFLQGHLPIPMLIPVV